MDKITENKIISEYKKGESSLKISKIVGLSKPTILKVLNEHNLVRKRDRCSKLKYQFDGKQYSIERVCPICNQKIKTKSKDKTICCRNHLNKLKGTSLCKSCSLKLQTGEGNPFYGKKHTKKTLLKISKSRKGKGTGNNNAMSNPIWRKKSSENLKKKWASGELEETRKLMSEHMKKTIRSGKIKYGVTSKKEKQIIQFLKEHNITSIQSYRVDTKICDIYISSLNLIIEYFGDYWHCNPDKYDENYFNQKKGKTAKQIWDYDKNKIDLIRNFGYNLEVIWENDLKHDNKKILEILNKYDSKNRFAPERS
jgi:G:T-mismatch repair DNA endonuclease (very short patch repair protein)